MSYTNKRAYLVSLLLFILIIIAMVLAAFFFFGRSDEDAGVVPQPETPQEAKEPPSVQLAGAITSANSGNQASSFILSSDGKDYIINVFRYTVPRFFYCDNLDDYSTCNEFFIPDYNYKILEGKKISIELYNLENFGDFEGYEAKTLYIEK